MDFETCIASHSSVLMEGALGERLKREYGPTHQWQCSYG